ncbi:MAG: hypothetical protein LBG42_00220 [Treponema sp.]|jgi:hypothetical protein|nr:hypothetical protein [Treponema sp.]
MTEIEKKTGMTDAEYVRSQANALHKTPAEIISELVREKIAASALQEPVGLVDFCGL